MKSPWFPASLLAAALPLGGCSSAQACPDIACLDSASVTLTALATQLAADLPVTVTVCLGATCTAFRVDHTGAAPICTALSVGDGLCTIDGEGNIVLTSLPLPAGSTGGSSVTVHATATSASAGSLFDQTETATVFDFPTDDGDCPPECHHAVATFGSS